MVVPYQDARQFKLPCCLIIRFVSLLCMSLLPSYPSPKLEVPHATALKPWFDEPKGGRGRRGEGVPGERNQGGACRSDARVRHLGVHDGPGLPRRPRTVHILDPRHERRQAGEGHQTVTVPPRCRATVCLLCGLRGREGADRAAAARLLCCSG